MVVFARLSLGLSKHWRAAELAMSLAAKCICPGEEWEYHYPGL